MERIEADILIPGRGEPIHDGCVVLDGLTIAYTGPTAGAPVTPGAGIYRVPAVLPGLWDCHAHFMGVFTPNLAELATNAPALTAMRVARDAAVAYGNPGLAGPNFQAVIRTIDLTADAGVVGLVESDWYSCDFVDYFSVARTNGVWQITNKTYAHMGGVPPVH